MRRRAVTKIIVHCSASSAKTTVQDIRSWHKQKGWKDIGYHFVIEQSGALRNGRGKDEIGAHCEGYNEDSLGICMVGGLQGNGSFVAFTKEQLEALKILIEGIYLSYGRLPVYTHHYFNKGKSCPNFDVNKWIEDGMPATPSKYTVKAWKD